MRQPSAPQLPSNNTYSYVPAPYYNQVQQPQPIYYAPYFNDSITVPPQQHDYQSQTNIQRSEGCLAGALTTLFCCCLIAQAEDM